MRTKILFYVCCIFLLQVSCVEPIPPLPPSMTISPDSIMEISTLKSVKYNVSVSSNEELTNFKITSDPTIFTKDTMFDVFTHKTNFSFDLKLPYMLNEIPEDSIITLTMEISDEYSSTKATRLLKITDAYSTIISKTIKLDTPPEGRFLYSFSADSLFYITDNFKAFADLAFYWDSVYKFVLCSSDAKFLKDKLTPTYTYDYTIMHHTKMQRIYQSWSEIDAQNLYELSIYENFINGNPLLGVGIDKLVNDNIIGFELSDGRKGAIKVIQTAKSGNSITLYIKLQAYAL